MARENERGGTRTWGWRRRTAGGLLAVALVLLVSREAVRAANALGLWTTLPAVPTVHQAHEATLLGDGKLLVAGGLTDPFSPTPFSQAAELYLPATDQWLPVGNMRTGRAGFGAALAGNGRVVAAGGWQNVSNFTSGPRCGDGLAHDASTSVEIFDPATLSWTSGPAMSAPRADFDLVRLLDGRILAAGGSTSKAAEVFNPATNTWSSAGSMFSWRVNAAYVRIPGGRVLVAGGNVDTWPFCSSAAEIYDPGTNSWTATNPMPTFRAGATATLVTLSDGTWRVLAAGGYDPSQAGRAELSSAELYDPATNSWTATASMNMPRAFHTATALNPSGMVLVTGGKDSNAPSSTAEVFDPTTLRWTFLRGMSSGRANHTATQLLGPGPTRVVVVGGTLGAGAPSTPSAELFQPTPIIPMISLSASGTCQPITLVASVASPTGHGSPTGNVSFWDGQAALGTFPLDASRQATLTLGPLPYGNHQFFALYSGDAPFDSNAATLSLSVSTPPSVTLAGPTVARALGTPVTLTASVTGGTGPYSFAWDRDGQVLSGSATLVDTPPLGVSRYALTVRDSLGCSSTTAVRQVDVFDFQLGLSARDLTLLRAGQQRPLNATITLVPGSSTNGLPSSAKLEGSGLPKDLVLVTQSLPIPQTSGGTESAKVWLRPGTRSLGDFDSAIIASAGGGGRSAVLRLHLFDYSLEISPALATGYRSGPALTFITVANTVTPGSTAALPPAPTLSAAGLPPDATYLLPALNFDYFGGLLVQPGPVSSGDFLFTVTSSSPLGTRSASATLRLLLDSTPPDVTPLVNGVLGANGWYVGNVDVEWIVDDPESAVSTTTGCTYVTVTVDTAGTTFTCTATSDGGTTTRSVTIRRDSTPPILNVPGTITRHQDDLGGSYVTYTVTASDNVDPSPTFTCAPASGSLFPLGNTTVACQATNVAGLTSTASFIVSVVP